MDLSEEAQYASRWVEKVSPESRLVIADAVKSLDTLPVSFDLLALFWKQLIKFVEANPVLMSRLDGLAEYCQITRSPQALLVLFERDAESLPVLLRSLSISPQVTRWLLSDPEAFELLRITKGKPLGVEALLSDLQGECKYVVDDSHLMGVVSRFKNRELVRIAFGQWFGDVAVVDTYRQLSILESAIIQTTSLFIFEKVSGRLGIPLHPSGRQARHMIFAFDGLGGQCQGYSSLLRLMILAETKGRTSSSRIVSNADFYDRFAIDWTELMASELTISSQSSVDTIESSPIYQLSSPVQPQQMTASWIVDIDVAFQHYDLTGRTWERELFVGARYVGGDEPSADHFLSRLRPWIYRRYVGDADIAGLGAMQRKLRRRLEAQSSHRSEAIDESRAIGDLEQTIRFLQLLHGHQFPKLRISNYADAIDMLYEQRILLKSEYEVIRETYEGLLEIKSIHELNADFYLEPTKNALRRQSLAESIEMCRTVVRQRLDSEFPHLGETAEETDLILDPLPNPGWVSAVLKRHRFSEATTAYGRLMEMARENGHILSTRKCRYYLSNIAPQLLASIAKTPDPDWTLMNLDRVTNVLGGKGILWELLSSSPAIMQLLVRVCGSSEYLVNILTQSPGMIDDLLNSLLLDRLPREQEMMRMLDQLSRQADDLDTVIRDFKSAMHLQVGVRDVMSKETMLDTHIALASIAKVCLSRIIDAEYSELVKKFGNPTRDIDGLASTRDFTNAKSEATEIFNENTARFVVVALGKLGGLEPNYRSDLSLVFLFDHDGTTVHEQAGRQSVTTTNRHFFEELAQRVMKRVNRLTPKGRLYEIDFRFGPLGEQGLLAMRLDQFIASFKGSATNAIFRQALCKASPILGSPELMQRCQREIHAVLETQPFTKEERYELLQSRLLLEQSASLHNLKLGLGGFLDIEFAVQWLQMTRAKDYPEIIVPNTQQAIGRLQRCAILDPVMANQLLEGYHYLRRIESANRLMNTDFKHDLPTNAIELERLAYLTSSPSGEAMLKDIDLVRQRNRQVFEAICHSESTI